MCKEKLSVGLPSVFVGREGKSRLAAASRTRESAIREDDNNEFADGELVMEAVKGGVAEYLAGKEDGGVGERREGMDERENSSDVAEEAKAKGSSSS